jgi:thymidine phosphorylase
VEWLGGPGDLIESPEKYFPKAEVVVDVSCKDAGWVDQIDTRELGMAVVELGGGRMRAEDGIDNTVGLSEIVELGTKLDKGEPLCRIHARNEEEARRAKERVVKAVTLSDSQVSGQPVIYEVIEG